MARIKIVSGGQTGADTAALNFALRRGLPHGGWCPRGRKREDGVIPPRYRLRETASRSYLPRTQANVRDSDGTAILSLGVRLKGGSRKTAEFARKQGKPCLHLAAGEPGIDPASALRRFIRQHHIRVLNIAGPRKSEEPGIGRFVAGVLREALDQRARKAAR
ncbi:MAG TPA: putative molybdenum carrier protein [Clostridia bacterium]|nr:putative molybdenum carrier protein [Clostridia bacterium]